MTQLVIPAQPAPAKPARFTYRCPECGGTNIAHDATATWSDAQQRFVLCSVQDFCTCRDCDHQHDHGNDFFVKLEG